MLMLPAQLLHTNQLSAHDSCFVWALSFQIRKFDVLDCRRQHTHVPCVTSACTWTQKNDAIVLETSSRTFSHLVSLFGLGNYNFTGTSQKYILNILMDRHWIDVTFCVLRCRFRYCSREIQLFKHACVPLWWPEHSCAMCDFCLHINPNLMMP